MAKVIEENDDNNKEEEQEYVNIKVYDSERTEIEFKVRKSIPFAKILKKYCEARSKNPKVLRVAYNGIFFDLNESPESLGMKNGDEVEIMGQQTGGSDLLMF
ncbi:Small ubiquitin- modifier 2 [Hamiltosporidium tvaerminnensis]|nr:Small ubiquitin- modifier 2 [Hamiltosporidium tvaerminnensis]